MSDNQNEGAQNNKLLEYVAEVTSAYLSNNTVQTSAIPDLIQSIHETFSKLASNQSLGGLPIQKPAVPIKKSITRDHIVCLEDGKKLKMLKRYLRTRFGMTPDEYRSKWNLPNDYPMVAPGYAERRSEFAKKIGLGRKSK
jgi:MucR family transcriptional regulator, transcriptional regulator of exopolysaccharide biosynthesis